MTNNEKSACLNAFLNVYHRWAALMFTLPLLVLPRNYLSSWEFDMVDFYRSGIEVPFFAVIMVFVTTILTLICNALEKRSNVRLDKSLRYARLFGWATLVIISVLLTFYLLNGGGAI